MSEYSPIEPGAGKKRGGLAGCLVGCLVAAGLVVVLAIGAAIFVGWRLTREGPPAPEISLSDGHESLYIHARLRPDDPGVIALGETMLDTLRRTEAESGSAPRVPWIDSRQAAGWRSWLPLQLDVARRGRAGTGDGGAVVMARFESTPGAVRAIFRIVAFLVPSGEGAPLRRTEIAGLTVVIATPDAGMPGGGFAVALVGDRLVAAKELEDLRAVLTASAAPADEEPATLAEIARLDEEDGWGYVRASAPEQPEAIRLAVFSFDLVSGDVVRWRAALRSERPPVDREASAQALLQAVAGASLPEGLGLTLDLTSRWADDRTLVVEGTIDGFGAWAGTVFRSVPGRAPAIPSPRSPDTDPDPQT